MFGKEVFPMNRFNTRLDHALNWYFSLPWPFRVLDIILTGLFFGWLLAGAIHNF
jgi:hypothetical protein